MTRAVAAIVALFLHGTMTAQTPEECFVANEKLAAASAEHKGTTYLFAKTECRDVFLTDPERYAQLYDALAELAAEGTRIEAAPEDASLVPS